MVVFIDHVLRRAEGFENLGVFINVFIGVNRIQVEIFLFFANLEINWKFNLNVFLVGLLEQLPNDLLQLSIGPVKHDIAQLALLLLGQNQMQGNVSSNPHHLAKVEQGVNGDQLLQ